MGKRAAVLIGVSKYEAAELRDLRAVESGVDLMERWVRDQGFDRIERITDRNGGEVHAYKIRTAIKEMIRPLDLDQLVVYFAGHGVNLGTNEFWLLPEAPEATSEAVNVTGTRRQARYGFVPHVVFVSDACRTAAEGIQAASVKGTEVFPAPEGGELSKPVDIFYAAALGAESKEVKDPREAAGRYRAVYTEALYGLLQGEDPALIDDLADEPGFGVIRSLPLKNRLTSAVQARLDAWRPGEKLSQPTDAELAAYPEGWLSKLALAGAVRPRGGGGRRGPGPPREDATGLGFLRGLSGAALGDPTATSGGPVDFSLANGPVVRGTPRSRGGPAPDSVTEDLVEEVIRGAETFGPDHMETQCGFKVRGARVIEARALRLPTEVLDHDLVRVDASDEPDEVLIRFGDGRAVVLPAIPGFLAALVFQGRELTQVAYEPSTTSLRWSGEDRATELRTLRSVITQALRHGVFRPTEEQARELLRLLAEGSNLDPMLAIYASYAFDTLQLTGPIERLSHELRDDLGFTLFDVALLSGEIASGAVVEMASGVRPAQYLPGFPLFSRGWALVEVLGARLPPGLEDLRQRLAPSLWTLFDERGAMLLTRHFETRGS